MPAMRTNDLGRMAYQPALQAQREAHARVLAGGEVELLLVEHDPVITIRRRPGARRHLLVDEVTLAKRGIAVEETDRGGDITYHGPGQLVAYPILRLADYRLGVATYMRLLEQVVIDTLAPFGVIARREVRCTGVWVEHDRMMAKICAMGVRVKRGITMHGLALNVDPDMEHFKTIVPCGLAERTVTSMRRIMGNATPTLAQVRRQLTAQFQHALAS